MIDNPTSMGTFQGRHFYGTKWSSSGGARWTFMIKQDSQILAWIIVKESTILDNCVEILRTWVDPEHRQQGLMSTILYFLHKHHGLKIMSDDQHTPTAQAFWAGIGNKFQLYVIDANNPDLGHLNVKPYAKVAGKDYRYIIESNGVKSSMHRLLESIISPELPEFIIFGDSDI